MKVLFVQHANAIGGSAVSLQYLIRGVTFALPHIEPHVMLAGDANAALEVLYRPLVSGMHTLPPHSAVDASIHAQSWIDRSGAIIGRSMAPLRRRGLRMGLGVLIARERFDLVHLNGSVLGPLAEALLELKLPFIWHVREPASDKQSYVAPWVRGLMRRAPALIFLSPSDRESWVGAKPAGETTVIPNAVDFDRFQLQPDVRHAVRNRHGIPQDAPVVLYVGGAVNIKGVRQMIQSIDITRRTVPEARLLMPGTAYTARGDRLAVVLRWCLRKVARPTLGDSVRQMLQERAQSCIAVPATHNVQEYYAAADVVAFPSLVPHFARPVIEALASRRAVVASDLDGVRELLPDVPRIGSLVPPGDVGQLASALVGQLRQRHDIAEHLAAAREEARERFGVERQGSLVADVYSRVLSGRQ